MSCVRATKIVIFVFLCTFPTTLFALRTGSTLLAGNHSASNVLDINSQKAIQMSGEGRQTETVTGMVGRHLLSNHLKRMGSSKQSQPSEQRPLEDLSTRHLQNDSWAIHPDTVTRRKRSMDSNYQSDFTGHGNLKKAFITSPGPGTQTGDRWQSMRPTVECAGDAMTLTAQGRGYMNLLVDREGSSPVSLFHLPPHCGYNMKYTWRDLTLKVPYDGCYIVQENGWYVLPLLWRGRPVRISCPVTSIPELLCSPVGMVLKVAMAEDGEQTLKAKVGDKRVALVSETCAHHMDSLPEEPLYFAPYTAACVTLKDGQSTITIVIGGTEFTMACPLPMNALHSSSPPSSIHHPDKAGPEVQSHPHPPPSHSQTKTPAPAPPTPATPVQTPGSPEKTSHGHLLPYLFPYVGQKFPGHPDVVPMSPSSPQSHGMPSAPAPGSGQTADSVVGPSGNLPPYQMGPHLNPYFYSDWRPLVHPHQAQDESQPLLVPTPPSATESSKVSTTTSAPAFHSQLRPYLHPHMGPVFLKLPHSGSQPLTDDPTSSKTPASDYVPGPEKTPSPPKGSSHGYFVPYPYSHMGIKSPSHPYPQREAPATPAPVPASSHTKSPPSSLPYDSQSQSFLSPAGGYGYLVPNFHHYIGQKVPGQTQTEVEPPAPTLPSSPQKPFSGPASGSQSQVPLRHPMGAHGLLMPYLHPYMGQKPPLHSHPKQEAVTPAPTTSPSPPQEPPSGPAPGTQSQSQVSVGSPWGSHSLLMPYLYPYMGQKPLAYPYTKQEDGSQGLPTSPSGSAPHSRYPSLGLDQGPHLPTHPYVPIYPYSQQEGKPSPVPTQSSAPQRTPSPQLPVDSGQTSSKLPGVPGYHHNYPIHFPYGYSQQTPAQQPAPKPPSPPLDTFPTPATSPTSAPSSTLTSPPQKLDFPGLDPSNQQPLVHSWYSYMYPDRKQPTVHSFVTDAPHVYPPSGPHPPMVPFGYPKHPYIHPPPPPFHQQPQKPPSLPTVPTHGQEDGLPGVPSSPHPPKDPHMHPPPPFHQQPQKTPSLPAVPIHGQEDGLPGVPSGIPSGSHPPTEPFVYPKPPYMHRPPPFHQQPQKPPTVPTVPTHGQYGLPGLRVQPPGATDSKPPHGPLLIWPQYYWPHIPTPTPPPTQTSTTTTSTTWTTTTSTAPVAKHPVGAVDLPTGGDKGPMLYYPPYQAPFPVPVCPPNSKLTCVGYPYSHHAMTTGAPQTPAGGPSTWGPPEVVLPGAAKPQPQPQPTPLDDGKFEPPKVSDPEVMPPTPAAPVPVPVPTKLSPSLSCEMDFMVVLLPTADKDSIQVKEARNTWIPVASAPPSCQYEVRPFQRGVALSTPLPACHSRQPEDPYVLSLPLKFWDIELGRYRYLDLRCPFIDVFPTTTTPPVPTTTTTTSTTTTVTTTTIAPSTTPTTTKATTTSGQVTVFPPIPPIPIPTPTPTPLPRPEVLCSTQHMTVALPPGPMSAVVVRDLEGNEVKVEDAPVHCGYKVRVGKSGHITVILPYNSCHVKVKDDRHIVELKYQLFDGRKGQTHLSCPRSTPPPGPKCDVPTEQRVACASGAVSASECHYLGCCYSHSTRACYYPMDECTADGHFVFTVPSTIMSPPLNPAMLVAGGNASCPPLMATSDYALFKIPLNGCGAHKFEVGQTVIYMVEILNTIQTVSLNYGTITRESPVRVLVECRFLPGSVVSVGYLVKRPSLGPSIHAQGVFGVQLRISKDHTYSSYHPQYHLPLHLLLGRPLYLEVRLLNPPDPSVVLLVHYCVAYPRSAHAAWVLIYDGCPNPLDPAPVITPTPPPPEVPNQTRRFTVSAFQFLTNGDASIKVDSAPSDEEIYFMCSTEICSPSDGPCVEGCFSDSSKGQQLKD